MRRERHVVVERVVLEHSVTDAQQRRLDPQDDGKRDYKEPNCAGDRVGMWGERLLMDAVSRAASFGLMSEDPDGRSGDEDREDEWPPFEFTGSAEKLANKNQDREADDDVGYSGRRSSPRRQ